MDPLCRNGSMAFIMFSELKCCWDILCGILGIHHERTPPAMVVEGVFSLAAGECGQFMVVDALPDIAQATCTVRTTHSSGRSSTCASFSSVRTVLKVFQPQPLSARIPQVP